MRPYGIAATLSDAVALTAAFGPGAKIGIGAAQAIDADILAPSALTLQPVDARAALNAGRPQYVFTFGNTTGLPSFAMIGAVMEMLSSTSGTGFVSACFAAPWLGRTVYEGHLFQSGGLQSDLKRDLAPYLDGTIAIVPHSVTALGVAAIRGRLTMLKEQGVRLALIDAIDEEDCGVVAEALSRQPVLAGPAWLSPHPAESEADPPPPSGGLAILSGALHRQTLMQIATARLAMPVLDLDLSGGNPAAAALAWATPYLGNTPFLIASSAPPDKIRPEIPAAQFLAEIALSLAQAGARNFLLAGNDTAAAILDRLGIVRLIAGAAFAGLRWLHGENINILIKPGEFGGKNLFLYDFEPQSRLNESAE